MSLVRVRVKAAELTGQNLTTRKRKKPKSKQLKLALQAPNFKTLLNLTIKTTNKLLFLYKLVFVDITKLLTYNFLVVMEK